ncbi:MAG: PDZ domain-containing protein [Deltaproteobacteria bacterium]|nr:PDZ domain-containing protein [Deltaproteobacteria bacterium]
MGDCGFSLFGNSTETAGVQQAQQKAMQSFADSPEAKNYVCFETEGLPWTEGYDINKDGKFGVDDMKALRYQREDRPIDSSKENLDINCTQTKVDLLRQEAKWKLQELIAWQPVLPSGVSILGNIDAIQAELLAKLQALSNDIEFKKDNHAAVIDKWNQRMRIAVNDANAKAKAIGDLTDEIHEIGNCEVSLQSALVGLKEKRSIITELTLRARDIAKNPSTTDELFGCGFVFIPNQDSGQWWPLKIANVLPFGAAAAAGILVGDRLLAVDGKAVKELSVDGSYEGTVDTNNHLMHGFAKPRDSSTRVTIKRGDREFDVVVTNNIWSGRYTGVAPVHLDYDGKVSYLPKSKTTGHGAKQ